MLETQYLHLDRCPWCKIYKPGLIGLSINGKKYWQVSLYVTDEEHYHGEERIRYFQIFKCTNCTNLVLERSDMLGPIPEVIQILPETINRLSDDIPKQARDYLTQAQETLAQPDASVMVCAKALDVMLSDIEAEEVKKTKGSKITKRSGNITLYKRIQKAVERKKLTPDMAEWAHQIRLVANDSRHPGEGVPNPTLKDAEQSLEFASVLAEALFVLPKRVSRGREEAATKSKRSPKRSS